MAGASVVEAWQLRLRGCSGGGNGGPRRLCIALAEMLDDALDDGGAFDAGDDPGVGAAGIADIDVNVSDRIGNTALLHAAEKGHVAIVRLLLTRPDTEVDHASVYGVTALLAAARQMIQAGRMTMPRLGGAAPNRACEKSQAAR